MTFKEKLEAVRVKVNSFLPEDFHTSLWTIMHQIEEVEESKLEGYNKDKLLTLFDEENDFLQVFYEGEKPTNKQILLLELLYKIFCNDTEG